MTENAFQTCVGCGQVLREDEDRVTHEIEQMGSELWTTCYNCDTLNWWWPIRTGGESES